jgi:hypothetical protein
VILSILLVVALMTGFAAPASAQVGCSYNVKASVVGGHGSVYPSRQYVRRGHTAYIQIKPYPGFHTETITDNGNKMPISNPYTIPDVKKYHDVKVTFAQNEYTVRASVSGGHGRVNPATQEVASGGTASIDLTPDPGYRAATITDNGATMPVTDPYRILNVKADHTVVVTFTINQYTVNASVHGGHGGVSPASQTVPGGATATVNFNPDTGYEVASISDNGTVVPVSNPYVMQNVLADHDVVVTFGVAVFTVTATAGGGHGTVTPPSQTVAYGGTASIDLTPDAGYHAASITDNGASQPVSDPYVINNVTVAHDVVVTFAIDQYTVNASVDGGGGSVSPNTQTVYYGGTASITYSAQGGYHATTITDNGVSKPISNPYVITGVAAGHNVIYTFASTNFMVAATVAGGHGNVVPTTQTIASGDPASIDLNADSGYHVLSITDNGVTQTIAVHYVIPAVTQDHSVVVSFAADQFTVDAAVQGPGGTVDPATQSVVLGGTGAVNIHPAAGYHIEEIIDSDEFVLISNPYVITNVRRYHDVTVVFDNNEYAVNAAAVGGHGSVSPPTQRVPYGDSATIDITPDPGYHIATIVDSGTPVAPIDPYMIDNVTGVHDVSVTFVVNNYGVDASVNGGHGSVAPDAQPVAGTGTAAINIVADTGYHIETITDNGAFARIANPYIITNVVADHDVVVTFAIDKYTAKATVARGNGSVVPDEQTVVYGDTAVIDLVPEVSYHPAAIIDNGERVAVNNPYYIPDTVANHNVTVAYAYDESPTFYLAEGSTDHGFSTYITIENPNARSLNARLTYMLSDGKTKSQKVGLPALSQVTVNPADTLGAADFSTQVTCLQGKTIAVDRTMTWTGPGAPSPEAHSSVGVTSPETTWYLPEGCSGFGFETWTLVENPNNAATNVTLTYMIEGLGPKSINRRVPPHSRSTYSMESDIGRQNASIEVGSSLPVIAERSMYRNNRREGSDSIGTSEPSRTFYLAEGSTAWGFTTYVLVQNPNASQATVTLRCMTTTGPKTLPPFSMAPGTRETVLMNNLIPDTDFSTEVTSNRPVVAERAMYWGRGTALGEACHDSIGLDEPHATFYLPDGQTSDGRETYTLVANPNNSGVQVMISYLFADGSGASYFIATVPANSRATYDMSALFPSGRASIAVNCLTGGKKVLAERSMYWNDRGAGTDTVGDWSH